MKTLILMVALISINTHAQESRKDRLCGKMYKIADLIMQTRQSGHAMDKLIFVAGGDEELIKMIIDAYKKPLMQSDDKKMQMRTEYASKKMIECYKS
jgi:hypothetical protein